jgi:predicted anti-sigma-YlaC factor YlaD
MTPSQTCETIRVALSARLDNEDTGIPEAQLAAHLESCAECRQWLARAHRVEVGVVDAPDLTDRIMAAVAADAVDGPAATRAPGPAPERRRILQVATIAIAAVQVALALPDLLGALGFGPSQHVSHEIGCLDLALAVGFLLAGLRPALAAAYTPVAIVLATGLVATSGLDVLHHRVGAGQEVAHMVIVAQAALVWGLARSEVRSPRFS